MAEKTIEIMNKVEEDYAPLYVVPKRMIFWIDMSRKFRSLALCNKHFGDLERFERYISASMYCLDRIERIYK